MAGLKWLVDTIWTLLNLNISISPYTFKLWYFFAFPFILGLFWKLVFGGGNNDK
jgi:hypothetical protein